MDRTGFASFFGGCISRLNLAHEGLHHRPRRATAQSQGLRPRDPAPRVHGHHRTVGLGQVLARVRHDLRRGTAPLRRVAVRVRAPVPRAHGKARRRLDRRALARGGDRAEEPHEDVAVDGRHGDRDLRLPAAALGARRPHVLSAVRPRDASGHRAVRRPTRCSLSRPERASTSPSRCMLSPEVTHEVVVENLRAQGFVRVERRRRDQAPRRPADRRRSTSRSPRSCWSSSTASSSATRRAAVSPTPSAPRSARATATASSCSPSRFDAAHATAVGPASLHRTLRVRERRHARADADAAALLVQQPARRVRALQRIRRDARVRRSADRAVPDANAARRRDRSVDQAALRQQAPRARRVREARGHFDGHAVGEAAGGRARRSCSTRKAAGYKGILPFLDDLEEKKYKQYIRVFLRQYQTAQECPDVSRHQAAARRHFRFASAAKRSPR